MIVISDLGLMMTSIAVIYNSVSTVDTVERVEKEEKVERVDTTVDTKYVKSSVKLCTTIKLSSHEKEKRRWSVERYISSIRVRTDWYERVRFFLLSTNLVFSISLSIDIWIFTSIYNVHDSWYAAGRLLCCIWCVTWLGCLFFEKNRALCTQYVCVHPFQSAV